MTGWTQALPGRWKACVLVPRIVALIASVLALQGAVAQVSVSEGGTPTYSHGIAVPPGISGMSPNIGLLYSGGGVNGPVGYGWSIQGISTITRCPNIKAVDGTARGVDYSGADKLCLDGQRLIQTDAAGTPAAFPQSNDSLGGTGLVREYRTEKDTYARIRAYGSAAGAAANGPAYFKVWTKSGQIYEYGNNANATATAAIAIQGKTAISAWAVSRISDTLGNYIDFQYEQRDVPWGSGPTAGSPTPGHEWNLVEIRYTGTATQQPANKVVFEYSDRADTPGAGQDRSEAYHQGAKNVSVRRLVAVRTYTNWAANVALWPAAAPATAIKVKAVKLTYDQGPVTKRSRVTKIQECVGAAETTCLPPVSFNYASGADESYTKNNAFNLVTEILTTTEGTYGVLAGDFNGDGVSDILRWSDTPAQNKLWFGSSTGAFSSVPVGAGAGQFNVTDQNVFKSDQCYFTIAADFNADGMTDLLRLMRATSVTSTSCGTLRHILYLSNGDGSFRSTDVTGIDFTQSVSSRTVQYDCLQPFSTGYRADCVEPGNNYLGTSQSTGRNFHILDVNGDGVLDIVTSMLPGFVRTLTPPTADQLCSTQTCSWIYLGSSSGTFAPLTATNVANKSLYAAPPKLKYANYFNSPRRPYVLDVSGDGLADLGTVSGTWISRGDGNFDLGLAPAVSACEYAIDFNSDGRSDCLILSSSGPSYQRLLISDGGQTSNDAAAFNLKSVGQEMLAFLDATVTVQTTGIQILDAFDGSRAAILRWKDNPTANTIYVSNGEGSFRESSTFNLKTLTQALRHSDGSSDFAIGDFTGRGLVDILRLKNGATSVSEATGNQLYVRSALATADQLVSFTSSTGLTTTLTWVPLSNSASGSLGNRYSPDRGTANAAAYPVVDLTMPMQVVATSESATGVGASTVKTEYSYAGLKAAYDGRGLQGFRETRRQSPGPEGTNLTVLTRYLQSYPYGGVAHTTETYLGALNALPANPISRSTFTYCEKTAIAGAEAAASPTAPCAVPATTRIQKPYLYKSVEQGWELPANGGAALPSVTTTNVFNDTGDPTSIGVSTAGTALGLSQTFTKTTTNQYYIADTTGDNWVLGRLQRASQQSSVPNSLGSIATGYGSAPLANATQGQGAILSLAAPSFPNTQVGLNVTASATLSNTGAAAGTLTAPTAGSVTGTDFSFVSTTCGTSLAAGANCTTTVRFAPSASGSRTGTLTLQTQWGARTASLSGTGLTPPALALTGCTTVSPTTAPTAATLTCTLSNTGQAGASSISYSAIAGATVSGPTGACAGGATCGTVTVTSGTTAGTYSGTLTVTPNSGTAATRAVSLSVTTPAGLNFSGCTSTSPTTPTAATMTCTLSNSGQTAIASISYSAIAGITVSGPTGACAASATCGTVTLTSGTAAGTYSGTLTATPNTGTVATMPVSLVVKTPPALALSGCTSTSPTVAPTAATFSCSLSNTGQTATTSIAYGAFAGASVSGPTGVCNAGTTCGTVTVTSGTAAGVYSGTLTVTPNAGTAATTSVSLTVQSQPALALTGCSSVTPTTTPTAATLSCTLSNTGQSAASSIGYSAIAGATVSGPTGACGAGATCGTVTVTTGIATGIYVGSLVATPNAGTSASVAVNLTVLSQAALSFSGCTSVSPTSSPTPATYSCTLSNTGQTAASTIGYSSIAGASISGPTGTCAAGATCGSVTVTTGTAMGTYSGTLTATPSPTGSAASSSVNLTVTGPSLASSPTPLGFGNRAKQSVTTLPITLTNLGTGAATGLAFSIVHSTGYPTQGAFSIGAGGTCPSGGSLASGSSCTVNITFTAGCSAGSITGSLRTSGTNFALLTSSITGGVSSTGICN